MFEFLSWATTKLNCMLKLLLVFFINGLIQYSFLNMILFKQIKAEFFTSEPLRLKPMEKNVLKN